MSTWYKTLEEAVKAMEKVKKRAKEVAQEIEYQTEKK